MSDFTVHIVSERLLFRKTFCKLLAVLDAQVACQEESGTYDAVRIIPAPQKGAIIIDCAVMDTDSVVACMLHCLSIQPEAMIILVFDEQDDKVIDTAMSLGAMGVIIKATTPSFIIDSLQRILSGERCRPTPIIEVPRENVPEHIRRQLTGRQQKMLRAIMGGQSISTAAGNLGITPEKLVGEMRQLIAKLRGRPF